MTAACEREPDAVRGELAALADTVRGECAPEFDGDREEAARTVFAAFAVAGGRLFATVPEAAWDAVDAAVTARESDGPVGSYARAIVRTVPFPTESGTMNGPQLAVSDVRERLEDSDWRSTAVHLCTRHGAPEECLEPLAACLDADPATRRQAARAIDWSDRRPDGVADRLLEATDDDDPTVRAGAVGALCHQCWMRDGVPEWGDEAMAALADALVDDARVVRVRAAGVLDCYPSYLPESALWSALEPETRGRLALGALRADLDETAIDECYWQVDSTLVGALDATATRAVREEFRALGWPVEDGSEDLDSSPLARSAIAAAAETDPGGIDDPVAYVEAVRDRIGTDGVDQYESRLLRALFATDPDVVTDAVPALVTALETESPDADSREAARTLATVREDTPDAVSVVQETLVAAVGDPSERGILREKRLVALAAIDPDAAASELRAACESVDRYGSSVGRTVETVAATTPAVVAAVSDAAVAALEESDDKRNERLLRGLATVADHDPDALVSSADAFVDRLIAVHPETRTAAGRVLRTLRGSHPKAVPDVAAPLVETDPDDPAWPLGPAASESSELGGRAVREAMSMLDYRGDLWARRCGGSIAAVAVGDPEQGRAGARELVSRLSDDDTGRYGAYAFVELAEREPTVAAVAVDDLVRHLRAGYPDDYTAADWLGNALLPIADAAPDAVRDAITAHYGGPTAFVDADIDRRSHRERIVSAAAFSDDGSETVTGGVDESDGSTPENADEGGGDLLQSLLDRVLGENETDDR
ncbi:HEAT repeat domain-containing protein [Natrinema sp. SYSU A 869]|uniref:HEAT repeat domain-containing protein n=1 Tax=Natrinema sp. SYSU A 869 TaxID=2871694 RepID=UPI001CA449BE|nr:HEAT repeat domain-containing protein [Natrinema sp. SYSU A 869]